MTALTEQLRSVGVYNPHDFYNGDTPTGQVFILYHPASNGRGGRGGHWQVVRKGYRTDPKGPYYEYGHKTFWTGGYRGAAADARKAALADAQAWAAARYGIQAWQRDPFGAYGPAEFVTARLAALKAQIKGQAPGALKVYQWTDFRPEARTDDNRRAQTDEIVAAKSKAEARRIAGLRPSHDVTVTGNAAQIEAATASPGVVLWAPLNGPGRDEYRPVEQETA